MVELKTGWYSFITPLQVGAIAAGAPPEQLAPLEAFGRHLGAAFQITDDLLNLRADPRTTARRSAATSGRASGP